ncbi:hypothetical protein HYX12_04465 [Candidatus Woesearchaeota archaeon]|nr:hypothetical protein [Candidatus Woesearchaeota archaeon]
MKLQQNLIQQNLTKKNIILLVLILVFITFSSLTVEALGVRPAKIGIDAAARPHTTETFWVVNNDAWDFTATVRVEGEMAQYVTLNTPDLNFRADTDALPVEFEVNLPNVVPPGQSIANIVIEQELPSDTATSSSENVISSKVVLKYKIIIQGEYPEKYIVAKLNLNELDSTVEFVSEIENLGKEDVSQVQTVFYVNDKNQKEHQLETEEISLRTNENKLLRSTLDKSLFDLGEFEVSAITTFDGQQVEVVKKLLVGRPSVEVTYFDRFFTSNKINEYTMDLLNKWNQDIKNVFVDVEVKKDNQKVDEFRTKSVDLDAEMSKRINDYYDARERNPGKYTFDMVINFWNLVKMEQHIQEFQVEMLAEGVTINLAGKAATEGDSASSDIWWLMIVGIIFLIISIYIGWRYLHRRDYDNEENSF